MWRRFSRFTIVNALGVVVQLTVLAILTRGLHAGYLVATPLAIAAALWHNFAWHRRWTWADREGRGDRVSRFVRFALSNGAVSLVGNLGLMIPLIEWAHLEPIAANALAIAACGLINYWISDKIVFKSQSVLGPMS